jgi:hypothetical protein
MIYGRDVHDGLNASLFALKKYYFEVHAGYFVCKCRCKLNFAADEWQYKVGIRREARGLCDGLDTHSRMRPSRLYV